MLSFPETHSHTFVRPDLSIDATWEMVSSGGSPGCIVRVLFFVTLPFPSMKRVSEHRHRVEPVTYSINVGACRPDYSFSWF
jgi:hypothetical protein